MRFVGIIAEYHPFHNGHAAQLEMVRQAGACRVAVAMSPQVVQRGQLALVPAQVRVKAVLQAGADLVVALPAPYACATAQEFGAAGVALLTALGADTLAFGAESGTRDQFMELASLLNENAFRQPLQQLLKTGMTFAAARTRAVEQLAPHLVFLLQSPNNNLGIEYCRAILAQHSPMQPLPLPRVGTGHDSCSPSAAYASASYLRRLYEEQGLEGWRPFVPTGAMMAYTQAWQEGWFLNWQQAQTAILSRLRAMNQQQFRSIRYAGEGLDHRLAQCLRQTATLEELYAALKTKRYPLARLRRLVLDAALGYGKEFPALPPYLHLLGARRGSLPGLKQARLPVGTSLAQLEKISPQAALVAAAHSRAQDLAALCLDKPRPMGLAYTQPPVLMD